MAEKKRTEDAEAALTSAIRAERAVTAHRISVLTDQHKRQHKKSIEKNIGITQQLESVSNDLNAAHEDAEDVRKRTERAIKNEQATLSLVLREQKLSLRKSHNDSIALSIAKKSKATDKAKRARSQEIVQLNESICGSRKKLKASIEQYMETRDQLKHEKRSAVKQAKKSNKSVGILKKRASLSLQQVQTLRDELEKALDRVEELQASLDEQQHRNQELKEEIVELSLDCSEATEELAVSNPPFTNHANDTVKFTDTYTLLSALFSCQACKT